MLRKTCLSLSIIQSVSQPTHLNYLKNRKNVRRPISRVLFPPSPAGDGHSSRVSVAEHLARPTRAADSGIKSAERTACRPYLVLLPVGFTLPAPLPRPRCALTAPFHPYPRTSRHAGGLLSVALSLRSPSPGVTRHCIPVEPGLSSPSG